MPCLTGCIVKFVMSKLKLVRRKSTSVSTQMLLIKFDGLSVTAPKRSLDQKEKIRLGSSCDFVLLAQVRFIDVLTEHRPVFPTGRFPVY